MPARTRRMEASCGLIHESRLAPSIPCLATAREEHVWESVTFGDSAPHLLPLWRVGTKRWTKRCREPFGDPSATSVAAPGGGCESSLHALTAPFTMTGSRQPSGRLSEGL